VPLTSTLLSDVVSRFATPPEADFRPRMRRYASAAAATTTATTTTLTVVRHEAQSVRVAQLTVAAAFTPEATK
jgi:hypothetical protein